MALTRFLVELYVKDSDAATHASSQAHESMASSDMRFHWSIYVPEDETSLLLLEAHCAEDVLDALEGSGLMLDRICATAAPETGGDALSRAARAAAAPPQEGPTAP